MFLCDIIDFVLLLLEHCDQWTNYSSSILDCIIPRVMHTNLAIQCISDWLIRSDKGLCMRLATKFMWMSSHTYIHKYMCTYILNFTEFSLSVHARCMPSTSIPAYINWDLQWFSDMDCSKQKTIELEVLKELWITIFSTVRGCLDTVLMQISGNYIRGAHCIIMKIWKKKNLLNLSLRWF